MANLKVGLVSHYYDKISVAIITLSAGLNIGDTIKIVSPSGEFNQKVVSMQVEHKEIKSAKKGEVIGLKVDKPVKEKSEVFKIS